MDLLIADRKVCTTSTKIFVHLLHWCFPLSPPPKKRKANKSKEERTSLIIRVEKYT